MGRKKTKKQVTVLVKINGVAKMYTYRQRKDGRICCDVPNGYNSFGNTVYKTIYAHNLPELSEKIRKFVEGSTVSSQNRPFVDDIMLWLHTVKFNALKEKTQDAYESEIEHYIIPYYNPHLLASEISREMIQKNINTLRDKGLARSTIKKVRGYLLQYFSFAIDTEAIDVSKNPAAMTTLPKKEKVDLIRQNLGIEPKERKYLSTAEIKAIKSVIYDGYQPVAKTRTGTEYAMETVKFAQAEVFDFMLQTGLRAGEMIGLKYSDWDNNKKTINIQRSRYQVANRMESGKRLDGKKVIETSPKSRRSKSEISITDYANNILDFMHSKEDSIYTGYIVHSANGDPITTAGLTGRWRRIVKAAGIKDTVGLHCIRHTTASVLYHKTHDMAYVSHQLRHEDVSTTMNIYVDLLEETKNQYREIQI